MCREDAHDSSHATHPVFLNPATFMQGYLCGFWRCLNLRALIPAKITYNEPSKEWLIFTRLQCWALTWGLIFFTFSHSPHNRIFKSLWNYRRKKAQSPPTLFDPRGRSLLAFQAGNNTQHRTDTLQILLNESVVEKRGRTEQKIYAAC